MPPFLKQKQKGSLLIEIIISVTLFVISISVFSLLLSIDQISLVQSKLKIEAFMILQNNFNDMLSKATNNFGYATSSSSTIGQYHLNNKITAIDNFTRNIKSSINFEYLKHPYSYSLSRMITDTLESSGQSSCRPDVRSDWSNPRLRTIVLPFSTTPSFTNIDVVGHYLYLTSNTASLSDPDLIIADVSDITKPVVLSSLNTGPGLLSITVAGNYAYVGNTSINSQLQIIDIKDKSHPILLSSFKLPGTYKDATTVGNSIFYKAGKILLGTQKSQTSELHLIDVSIPSFPQELRSYEIGSAVNNIFAFKDTVYIAIPANDEIRSFSLKNDNLTPLSSYDATGGSGNGKHLSLFLDTLFLGRTVGKDELYALTASSSPVPQYFLQYSFPLNTSIESLLAYQNFLLLLTSNINDGFLVYNNASSSHNRLNIPHISFSSQPIAFDCDQQTFYIVTQNSSTITIMTPV